MLEAKARHWLISDLFHSSPRVTAIATNLCSCPAWAHTSRSSTWQSNTCIVFHWLLPFRMPHHLTALCSGSNRFPDSAPHVPERSHARPPTPNRKHRPLDPGWPLLSETTLFWLINVFHRADGESFSSSQTSLSLTSEQPPPSTALPAATQTQVFQPVSKAPHSSGINVNAAPFQSMQTVRSGAAMLNLVIGLVPSVLSAVLWWFSSSHMVPLCVAPQVFNLNAPVPPTSETEALNTASQYQNSYNQTFSSQSQHPAEQTDLQSEQLQSGESKSFLFLFVSQALHVDCQRTLYVWIILLFLCILFLHRFTLFNKKK